MLQYNAYQDIASAVFDSLNIPEDVYLTFTNDDEARAFVKQYSQQTIESLVDAEMANYDTSENSPIDVEDIRDNAIDEVQQMISDIEERYYSYKHDVMTNAYSEIVSLLKNTYIEGVTEVESEYEPADYSVGIYGEERSIQVRLTTGDYISFTVDFVE